MKLYKFFLILLCLFSLSACTKKELTKYDVYINNVGYKLNNELTIEVNLQTNNKNIMVCPVVKIEKENETDISKIAESINFSTDNIEFVNLYAQDFFEIYNDDYWSFESILSNEGEEVNLENGDDVQKIKIKLKEKGKYTISLAENNTLEQCSYKYSDTLSLNIIKE